MNLKRITQYWKFIYYQAFIAFTFFSNRIIGYPILSILKLKPVMKFYKKRGISDPYTLVRRITLHPEQMKLHADRYMVLLASVFGFGVVNFISGFNGEMILSEKWGGIVYVVCIALFPTIDYVFIQRNRGNYYYEQISQLPKSQRKSLRINATLFHISIWLFVIGSIVFMAYQFDK